MIDNVVKEIKQRQEAVTEQIKNLQAEAGKLAKALSVLETLTDVASKASAAKQPKAPKAKKRKMSAAGRKAIADAAKARWAKIKAAKAPKAPKAAQADKPKGKISLMDVVLKVLQAEKAQSIPEIIVAVNKAGYVSKSKTFATIIGQTLKNAGDKVVRVKRGLYALNS